MGVHHITGLQFDQLLAGLGFTGLFVGDGGVVEMRVCEDPQVAGCLVHVLQIGNAVAGGGGGVDPVFAMAAAAVPCPPTKPPAIKAPNPGLNSLQTICKKNVVNRIPTAHCNKMVMEEYIHKAVIRAEIERNPIYRLAKGSVAKTSPIKIPGYLAAVSETGKKSAPLGPKANPIHPPLTLAGRNNR